MTISILKTITIFLFLLLATVSVADQEHKKVEVSGLEISVPLKTDCGAACGARCRLSSRLRLCKRACGTCCARCNCVPPGTSGNQDVCPCYANLTTHGGKRKCP